MRVPTIEEFADYIDQETSLVLGDTLQVHHFPADAPGKCVCVSGQTQDVNYNFTNQAKFWLVLTARADSWNEARDLAQEIYGVTTDGIHNVNMPIGGPTEYVATSIATGMPPQPTGQDEKGRHTYVAAQNINILTY